MSNISDVIKALRQKELAKELEISLIEYTKKYQFQQEFFKQFQLEHQKEIIDCYNRNVKSIYNDFNLFSIYIELLNYLDLGVDK